MNERPPTALPPADRFRIGRGEARGRLGRQYLPGDQRRDRDRAQHGRMGHGGPYDDVGGEAGEVLKCEF